MGFEVGRRYLVSSSAIYARQVSRVELAAWQIHGAQADFVEEMYRGRFWPGLASATTLREALAISAPNAMPATDTQRVVHETSISDETSSTDLTTALGTWCVVAAALASYLVLHGRSKAIGR
jgi:hypothetical protein